MPTYTLELLIDEDDLRIIKGAQQNIVLAKPTGDNASPNVAWQSFDPFQENSVTWSEEYGLYASNTKIVNGARIAKMSGVKSATDKAYYSFRSDATFYGPNQDGDAPGIGQYRIFNEMPSSQYPALTFGLMQSATINGRLSDSRPLNAQYVPASQQVTFTPLTTVYVWLQSTLTSGTVITEVASKHTEVIFGGSVTTITLRYDSSRGMFVKYVPQERALVVDAPDVRLLSPVFT
ncbi:MAG TPA: hypothetical protein VFZ66_22790 [Herpetosiphonaceae bacterium]